MKWQKILFGTTKTLQYITKNLNRINAIEKKNFLLFAREIEKLKYKNIQNRVYANSIPLDYTHSILFSPLSVYHFKSFHT